MNYERKYNRFQTVYSITIYDTPNGELAASRDFKGPPPTICLSRLTITARPIVDVIDPPPSMDDIYAWFEEYVK
jgi:hypothetical protein